MELQKNRRLLKTISAILLIALLMIFAVNTVSAAEEIVVNDPYDPIGESQTENLDWTYKKFQSYYDTNSGALAFTPAKFPDSSDHIVFDGNNINFYGYGVYAHFDYLYYKELDNTEKTFKFTIKQGNTDYHTLYSYGFFMNCTENADGTTSGYYLALEADRVAVYMFENYDLNAFADDNNGGWTFFSSTNKLIASENVATGTEVGAESEHDFVLKSAFDSFSVMRNGVELLSFNIASADPSDVPANYTGGNDFGLYADYESHYCSSLSYAIVSNIELHTATITPKTNLTVEFVDYNTREEITPAYLRDAYVETGYVGQGYTVNVPDIENYTYVESSAPLKGEYQADGSKVILYYIAKEAAGGIQSDPAESKEDNLAKLAANPKTGESNTILIVAAVVLAVTVIAVISMVIIKRKKNKNTEV